MKFTTLNFKKDEYDEKHEILVGTHIGSFKRIDVACENPHKQENLQNLDELKKDSIISALNFNGNNTDEILIGRANQFVQVFDLSNKTFKSNHKLSSSIPVVGLCCYDNDKIVAGLENGNIEVISSSSLIGINTKVLNAGDHMSRMRECKSDNRFVATGGKERLNNLKIFDLETQKMIFTSKNVPNDFLQLEVPIWDTDLHFLNINTIATCSRYGYLRLYDVRTQRRPVENYTSEEFNFSCMNGYENSIYVGTTKGELKAFDMRNLKNFQHTYKGCTGSVSDLCLDENGKFLISGSLDRYVRVHNVDTCVLLYQCYVQTKATKVLVRNIKNKNHQNNQIQINYKIDEDNSKYGKDEEYEKIFEDMETIIENKNSTVIKANDKRKTKENSKTDMKKRKRNFTIE